MEFRTLATGGACLLPSAALAGPVLLYENDFQSGSVGPEWSANTTLEQAPAFTQYAGRYAGNEHIVLTLEAVDPLDPGGDDAYPPPGDGSGGGDGDGPPGDTIEYHLTFDLYAIDSWDGSSDAYGPDAYRVVVNDGIFFEETIANQHDNQTMRDPDVGREQLGYAAYDDSIYRGVEVLFTLPEEDSTMQIKFRGVGLQALNDESWGIDNVRVQYDVVPGPGTVALAAAGMLALARRRRA